MGCLGRPLRERPGLRSLVAERVEPEQPSLDGRLPTMTITIDAAGRVVIPKSIRDALGLSAGVALVITSDGVGVRIEPETQGGRVVEIDGELAVVSNTGRPVTDWEVREAIDAGRR